MPGSNISIETIGHEAANKNLIRRLIEELWNKRNFDAITLYLDEKYFKSTTCGSARDCLSGKDRSQVIKDFVARYTTAFPNIRFYIVQMIAEGETVAVHFMGVGTHMGEFMGAAPTGRQVDVRGAAIYRVINGKISESDEFVDHTGLQMQLLTQRVDSLAAGSGRLKESSG